MSAVTNVIREQARAVPADSEEEVEERVMEGKQ